MASDRSLSDVEIVARVLCCGSGGCINSDNCIAGDGEDGFGKEATCVVAELRKNNRLIVPPHSRPCDQRGARGECLTCKADAGQRCRYLDTRPGLAGVPTR